MIVAEKTLVKNDLHQAVHKYFGFDKFKGNQEEIVQSVLDGMGHLCHYAYGRWQVPLLPVACPHDGRNGTHHLPTYSLDEKPGGQHPGLWPIR